ncbi:MAG: hypothetical protein LBG74_08470 [Spirochaetaceae bacterium]|jgi:hypothetical protein|nr:hypothetical protein [Spirochaetaceae bacterium]
MKYVSPAFALAAALAFALAAALQAPPAYGQQELLDKSEDELFGKTDAAQRSKPVTSAGDDYLARDENITTVFAQPGFAMDASYAAGLGLFPGFSDTPWNFNTPWKFDTDSETFDVIIGAYLSATLGLAIQPSRFLRVRQTITFTIPTVQQSDIPILFKEFFVDFNIINALYFRVGKFEQHWGHSPNYPYADLLAHVPIDITKPGDAYAMRADIPIGVGGLQFVIMARPSLFANPEEPKIQELGYGLKFNLAVPFIDIDIGAYFHKNMPLRFFLSMNKTVFRQMEVYAESMLSYQNTLDVTSPLDKMQFSYSIGFINDFFDRRLIINGEFYYNDEKTDKALSDNYIRKEEKNEILLLTGYNSALNINIRPGVFWNTSFFVNFLYSYNINSGQVVSGVRFEPVRHLQIYLTTQTALGTNADNTYYRKNLDTANRPFAFSIIAVVRGVYNFQHYE